MIRLGLIGCTGNLGKDIIKFVLQSKTVVLNSAITRKGNQFVGNDISSLLGCSKTGITISDNIEDTANCDVLVDCTNKETFIINNLPKYEEMLKPLVIATTGFNDDDFVHINKVAEKIPVLISPNYSLGLYNFLNTVKYAVLNIDAETDIQILEYHHNEKKDSPSGTAVRILNSILESNPKLANKDIKISSIRAGGIVGEHRVILANCNNEEIELIHKVSSRDSFVKGIVKSAIWISPRPNGYYTIDDVIKSVS